jgi:hypothetical protein
LVTTLNRTKPAKPPKPAKPHRQATPSHIPPSHLILVLGRLSHFHLLSTFSTFSTGIFHPLSTLSPSTFTFSTHNRPTAPSSHQHQTLSSNININFDFDFDFNFNFNFNFQLQKQLLHSSSNNSSFTSSIL